MRKVLIAALTTCGMAIALPATAAPRAELVIALLESLRCLSHGVLLSTQSI